MTYQELVKARVDELLRQTSMSREECLAEAEDDVDDGWTPEDEDE